MRTHRPFAAVSTIAGLMLAHHAGAGVASFRPLDDLPGGNTYSIVWGLSRDGSTAVGSSYDSEGIIAAYWNGSGAHALESDYLGARPFAALAASADGSTIVGGMGPGVRAFAWRSTPDANGVRTRRLPELTGTTFLNSRAQDVDDSGRYAIGYSHAPDSRPGALRVQAVAWDLEASTPAARGLGYIDPVTLPSSNAASISGDGLTIVGDGRGPGSMVGFSMNREAAAPSPVDIVATATADAVMAANLDGSVIVGRLGGHGFRFSGEAAPLDSFGGGWTENALALSDDGSIVVGSAWHPALNASVAVIWDAQGHATRLDDLVAQQLGLDISGWSLTAATGVSGDGRTIAGYGLNPSGLTQGFVVTVPAPSPVTLVLLGLGCVACARRRRDR